MCIYSHVRYNMNKNTLNENDIYELSEFYKNLSDFSRVKIITSLLKGEKCVQDIAKDVDMSQTAVSYQLRILRHARLVKTRRDGKMIFYSIVDEHVLQILEITIEHLEHL